MCRKTLCTVILFIILTLIGCNSDSVSEIKKIYPTMPPRIIETEVEQREMLYKFLNMPKEKISFSENRTPDTDRYDDFHDVSYEVKIEGDAEKSGYYCVNMREDEERDGELCVTIAKALTKEELERVETARKFSVEPKEHHIILCKILYDGPVDELGKEKDLSDYKVPQIDSSHVVKYKETMLGTDDIWGAYTGYINSTDNLSVSYVEDDSGNKVKWWKGVFKDNKWVVKKGKIPSPQGEIYDYFGGEDGKLWYYTGKQIQISDEDGKILINLDLKKWKKENKLSKSQVLSIAPIKDFNCIFNIKNKNNKEYSLILNLKNGEIIKKYDFSIEGGVYGDYVIQYKGVESDLLHLLNWRTGEVEYKLNLKGIRDEYKISEQYIGYMERGSSQGFHELYDHDIVGIEATRSPLLYNVQNSDVYISYFSGVYRYDKESNTLIKILDGKNQPIFSEMHGDFNIAKDGTIYSLGFYQGGDDHGATDFLCLYPED